MMLAVSVVLGILPLLGIVWTIMDGTLLTVDGLFMTLILLTLSGLFFQNAFWECRDCGLLPAKPKAGPPAKKGEILGHANRYPSRSHRPRFGGHDAPCLHALVAGTGALLPPAQPCDRGHRLAAGVLGGAGLGIWQVLPGRRLAAAALSRLFLSGTLIMIVLFTSIFTMMSVIEDRKQGFLLSVMVAPVPRPAIVLGKVLGGTTLSAAQGLIFLLFAPFAGVQMHWTALPLIVLTVLLVSFALTALGFAIAWPMDSTSAFHAIINLFLIPLWLLSGALFPLSSASGWLRVLMRINPLTYGVEALRTLLYPNLPTEESLAASMATLVLFSLFMFGLAFVVANRRTTKPVA